MRQLILTARPGGQATIQTKGFEGATCLKATEGLKALMGGEVESTELTGEYYTQAEQHQELQGGG